MQQDYIFNFNRKVQKDYADRTGILVDIQNLGKNTELLATKEQKTLREIKPGVWLEKDILHFRNGNFSNVYDVSWNPNQIGIVPSIDSSNRPYSLFRHMKRDHAVIAAINGAFFFLTDVADKKPSDIPYDFCVNNGQVIGLPSSDGPVAIVQDGKLQTKEPKAKGTLQIGTKRITWIGAKNLLSIRKKKTAILYNSRYAEIIKTREKKTGLQIGIVDTQTTNTPQSQTVFDLVIRADKNGILRIVQIKKTGGSHVYSGNFILQIEGSPTDFSVGDRVTPLFLNGINLQKITSGITIGKKVQDAFFSEPERVNRKDARSVLAKDTKGHLHFIVFDGSKYIPGFHGVSAKDICSFFSPEKYQWAYFLDGGGSSRIIVREGKQLGIFANLFAFRKLKDGSLLWDWQNARKIASSISLRTVIN